MVLLPSQAHHISLPPSLPSTHGGGGKDRGRARRRGDANGGGGSCGHQEGKRGRKQVCTLLFACLPSPPPLTPLSFLNFFYFPLLFSSSNSFSVPLLIDRTAVTVAHPLLRPRPPTPPPRPRKKRLHPALHPSLPPPRRKGRRLWPLPLPPVKQNKNLQQQQQQQRKKKKSVRHLCLERRRERRRNGGRKGREGRREGC